MHRFAWWPLTVPDVVIYFGMAKPVRSPQIGPARQP
jgi:hypothetical protein